MSLDLMLRPLALASCAALCAASLHSASAQQFGAPTHYGAPYAPPPPSMAGARPQQRYVQPAPARLPVYERPGIWQGFYLGAHGGYGVGRTTATGSYDTVDLSGGTLGLHAGYNWQFREWVIGVEGDAAWSGLDGSRTFAGPTKVTVHNDWLASLRLRGGYTYGNALFYLTGGLAMANLDVAVGTGVVTSSASDTLYGFVVGGGLEMKVSPKVSARLEALHYGFNEQDFKFGAATIPIDTSVTTVRAGLTFHFN